MEQQPLNCSLAVSPLMQGPPPPPLTHGAYSTPASGPLPLLFAQRSPWPWLMSFRPQVRGILLLRPSCPPLRPLTLLYVLLLGCAYMCSRVHCGSSVSTTRQVPRGLALFLHLCPAWTHPQMREQRFVSPLGGVCLLHISAFSCSM